MKRKRIRCFVAMPFGRKDCDSIYKHKILPALKSLNIAPIRVDQREHKEDLNVYIIKMLDESDLALVDLTYARPSVYYEAGYAERNMPVAYTVRADHLSRAQRDDRLRVHFDLEMKKIIPWRKVDDALFAPRLKRRIKYLIGPLTQKARKDESLAKSREAFVSRSVNGRIEEIAHKFQNGLKAKRFWTASMWDMDKRIAVNFLPGQAVVAGKMVGRTCYLCTVVVEDSLEKKIIQYAVKGPVPRLLTHDEGIDKYVEYFFLCSLRKCRTSRIPSILPDAVPTEKDGTFTFPDTPPSSSAKRTEMIVRVMHSIDSYVVLRDYVKTCQGLLPLGRTNKSTFVREDNRGVKRVRFVV